MREGVNKSGYSDGEGKESFDIFSSALRCVSPENMKLKELEGFLGGLQQFPNPKVSFSLSRFSFSL